jgi:hypothetical protein
MTIISLPRVGTNRRSRRRSGLSTSALSLPSPRLALLALMSRVRSASLSGKALLLSFACLGVLIASAALTAETQVGIAIAQRGLTQAQASYAHAVDHLAAMSSPEQIVAAGTLHHLTVPSSVSQVASVSLDVPLALPHFPHHVAVLSRAVTPTTAVTLLQLSKAPTVATLSTTSVAVHRQK